MEVNCADLSHSSLRLILNFKEVITVNELVLQLVEVGKILENKFTQETDEEKKNIIREKLLIILKNDIEIINKEIQLYERDCPVDDIKINLYEQGLAIIDVFEKYIYGNIEVDMLRNVMEDLYKTMEQLHDILDKYSDELKILAISSMLLDMGWNIKGVINVNGENINEKKIEKDKMTEFLEECIKKIDIEKKNLLHSADKLLLDAIDCADNAVKNYIEAIQEDNINISIIDRGLDNIKNSVDKITNYQAKLHKSKKLGIAEYLIAVGKEIKNAIKLCEDKPEELEKYLAEILENLTADQNAMEKKKKSYISSNDDFSKDILEITSSTMQPVNDLMAEVYDKSIDVINNYIDFIKSNRSIALINDGLNSAIQVNYILDKADKTVKNLQSLVPQSGHFVGEA